ncbi:MAG: sigma-70 family RNA polymerase sigma factor [bacterium]|nr:sigma-70 family RNA polymerase sigma factor [bacterium]
MPPNDSDLITEIRAGSQTAFDRLMQRHEHFVFRVAYPYVGDADSALDVCQNVFIKVHRRLDTFRGATTFRAWLARIAQNESLSWLRSRQRFSDHQDIDAVDGPASAAVQNVHLVESERQRDLRAEIDRLNPTQQQAVVLRYYEKMPLREIGETLECSEGQVKSILFRSIRKLRDNLGRKDRWDRELEA